MAGKQEKKEMTYQAAGVDTRAGQSFVRKISGYARATQGPQVLGGLGGFAALFRPDWQSMEDPVLVAATDGVGTKIELARQQSQIRGLGQDLVAMCANDLLTVGAAPLFFLDYLATGKLDPDHHAEVVRGIAEGCQISRMALIGGETAEHPGVMGEQDFDLAGFCVGMVDRARAIDGAQIRPGDKILALGSTGIHSNGFSLVRRILSGRVSSDQAREQLTRLLRPTALYTPIILDILRKYLPNKDIRGMAHITGGGFYENIPRVLPAETGAKINTKAWEIPDIFQWLQKAGDVSPREMFGVFNMGAGYLVVVDPAKEKDITEDLIAASKDHYQSYQEIMNGGNGPLKDEENYLNMEKPLPVIPLGEIISREQSQKADSHPLSSVEDRLIFT